MLVSFVIVYTQTQQFKVVFIYRSSIFCENIVIFSDSTNVFFQFFLTQTHFIYS